MADVLTRMMTACALTCGALVLPAVAGQKASSPPPPSETLIRRAVVRELGEPLSQEEVNFVSRQADLNGDGRAEVLVWVPSHDYGGTGGYPLLIFRQEGRRLRRLAKFGYVWTPLYVLDSARRGWRDLVMLVGGGGEPMRYVRHRHNGKTYSERFREIREERIRGRLLIEKDWVMTPLGPLPSRPRSRPPHTRRLAPAAHGAALIGKTPTPVCSYAG